MLGKLDNGMRKTPETKLLFTFGTNRWPSKNRSTPDYAVHGLKWLRSPRRIGSLKSQRLAGVPIFPQLRPG